MNDQEKRITISDSAILARYLPPALVGRLLESEVPPSDHDLIAHIARLQELLQIVVTYVPEYAGITQRSLPTTRAGYLSRVHGTLLAADLSGFTAFSRHLVDTLKSEGTESKGAELVARTVSDLFSTLLEGLAEWSGNLLKLSGDALTALFSGRDHARHAVAAALDLQRRMAPFQELVTPAGVYSLHMRIGLASGDVLLAEVGTRERVELLVAGATARRAIETQRLAAPGAVVVDAATYQQSEPDCQALTIASGLYKVLAIDPAPERLRARAPRHWTRRHNPVWELYSLIARLEALRPYLVDQHLARLAAGPPSLASEGDLRPVTALFASLDDVTPLLEPATAGEDDPAIETLQANAQRVWSIVERYGGTINKLDLHSNGHTLIALFGAPVAQGNDTERAVSCALALLHEAPARQAGNSPLLVRRIGLATGRVFAGAVGSSQRREYTVMGPVVNLASRLMDVAGEGQALISDTTARALQGRFRLHAQPPVLIKGYDEPIPFYLVAPDQRSPLSTLLREQGPMVGRDTELAQARACVARALAGQGAVVALVGEAGIGKSRLLSEIVRTSLVEGALSGVPNPGIVVHQAQPHHREQPYALIAQLLRLLSDLPEHDDQAAATLVAQVQKRAPDHERFLPLLLAMLGLPSEESIITQALTPEERRGKLHSLVVALIAAHARAWPTALVIEDLHWGDAASLDLLGEAAIACAALPLLILCSYRLEEAPTWPSMANVTRIVLRGLLETHSAALLATWLGPLTLPDDLRKKALERTQGNPFFLAETARVLRERGIDAEGAPPLPATVQGALLARLDRLSNEERFVLQIAAVIDQPFQQSLLAGIAGDRVPLERVLEQLIGRELLRYDGPDSERYAFTHRLIQETIYESLLFAQRRDLHRQVADRLRADDPRLADEEPSLLAYHYRRAEVWDKALEFSWRAGVRAQALYVGTVAHDHFQHALRAVERLADPSAARWRPAILRRCGDIHVLPGRYAEAIKAYRDAITTSSYERERAEIFISWADVCQQQATYDEALALLDRAAALLAPDDALALRVAVRRGWILARQGASDAARAAVEPVIERLEQQEHWSDLLLAYRVFFHVAAGQGRWSEARTYLRLALIIAERVGDIREIARLHSNLGYVLVQEGDLRQAAQSCEHCARVMEEIDDRFNLAQSQVNIGVIYYKLGDFHTALDAYTTALRIATAIGAPLPEAAARSNLGEIYRHLGRLPESLDQLLRSAELSRQIHDDLGLAEAYRQLAETYIALDRLLEAREACDQALAIALEQGDRQSEAIVYRVRGRLAAARADYESALDDTQRSIRILTDLGSTHELGQSMVEQATMLIRQGQPVAACSLLEEAIRLLRRAGAAADVAHAQQLLDSAHIQALAEEVSL